MSDARQRLTDRTKYVFEVPSRPASLSGSLALAALAGVVGFGATPTGVGIGFLLIGIPAVVATALTPLLDGGRGDGTFDAEQSALLALACTTVVTVFVIGAAAIQSITDVRVLGSFEWVLLASAGIFAFRLLVMVSVSGPPLASSVVPAGIQSTVTVLAVVGFAAVERPALVTPATLGVVFACAALYTGIVLGLVALVDYPLRREWGVSAFEFVHQFLEYTADQPTDLESYFTRLGESVAVPVTVLSVRRRSGEEKARIVSTRAHFGPFAGIGGGTLPYRFADGPGLTFTPHGMADHDYNPTSQAGVTALCDAADRALADVTYDRRATPPIQQSGDVTLTGQAFGDGALVVSTFAPRATDDINHGVGRAAAASVRNAGIEHPLLVDAHNCQSQGGIDGRTLPGSDRARTLTAGVERMAADLAASDRGTLRVGVAADPTPWGVAEGIGPLGIRAFATDIDGTTAVFVLIDGNNMVAGLRDTIRDALDADVVEVLTTDSHEVNHLSSANYVGSEVDTDELVSLVETVGTAAIADLEPVVAGTARAEAELTVFGEGTVERLVTFADRILPVCAVFVGVMVIVVTAIAIVLFWLA